jgi:RNA binding exosome subunit
MFLSMAASPPGMFLWIDVSAFCYATESAAKVALAMSNLFPGVKLNEELRSGYHGVPIVMLSMRMTDELDMDRLFERLGADVTAELLRTIEARLDGERVLHIRLDKQALVQGRSQITSHGDSIVIRCKFEAKTEIKAIEALRARIAMVAQTQPPQTYNT